MSRPTIWADVEDLFLHGASFARPTGIQRLAFELCQAMVAAGGEARVRFVRHSPTGFSEVSWIALRTVFALITGAVAPPPPPRAIPTAPSFERVAVLQREAAGAFGRAFGRAARRLLAAAPNPAEPFARAVRPGDVLFVPGSPWLPHYDERIAAVQRRHGMRAAMLAHDMLPLRHPEWSNPVLRQEFKRWTDSVLPLMQHVFANSRATASDVEAYARETGIALQAPVRPIPVGSGFTAAAPAVSDVAPADDLPAPGSYVLMVSTIEPRKNHILLFRVWQHLLGELGPAALPTLVFAGRPGWMVRDFMQMLENSRYLDGHVRILPGLGDAALAALYRGCLFTLYPSFYEGWGLPVTESLAFGKPCIISHAASLPEAGGELARYFDPEETAGATRLVREALQDRAGLAAWQARVVAEFRPVPWEASAQAVLTGLEQAG